LPDFRSINGIVPPLSGEVSVGFGGGFTLLADYFGNVYGSINFGVGLSLGLATYSEGYVFPNPYNALFLGERIRITNEAQMKSKMQGLCGNFSYADLVGFGVGACPNWPVTHVGSGIMVFGMVLSAGADAQASYTFELPTLHNSRLGWKDFFTYRRNGISRADVERKAILQLGKCDE